MGKRERKRRHKDKSSARERRAAGRGTPPSVDILSPDDKRVVLFARSEMSAAKASEDVTAFMEMMEATSGVKEVTHLEFPPRTAAQKKELLRFINLNTYMQPVFNDDEKRTHSGPPLIGQLSTNRVRFWSLHLPGSRFAPPGTSGVTSPDLQKRSPTSSTLPSTTPSPHSERGTVPPPDVTSQHYTMDWRAVCGILATVTSTIYVVFAACILLLSLIDDKFLETDVYP